VRAAAADVLEPDAALSSRLRSLLGQPVLATRERIAAFTFLLRDRDGEAREELDRALKDPAQPREVVEHLEAISLLFDASAPHVVDGGRAIRPRMVAEVARRPLGHGGPEVAPLAVSGVYQLAPGALARAAEAGVNLFFWEPRHTNLTRFLRGRRQRDLHVVAGTFNAHRAGIEHDLELALRRLGRDRIDVFLLFWARSAARLSRESFELLQRLKAAGKIGAAGFSTHDRALAAAALEQHPWDVVMIRHSAAHPGAEDQLLPLAQEKGVGVLTFSALCYGRLLKRVEGERSISLGGDPPTAADCYRYSLSQPGVTACISAPRRFRELAQNLEVLEAPTLDVAAAARLREHGAHVHRENRRFDRLLRRGEAGLAEPEVASVELPSDPDQPRP
jgi:aryl-alcohol dehydrogenase-like predicted oxidoreductase